MYTLPKDKNTLQGLIDVAISAASTMRQKVQVAAIAILYHAYKHGDYTYANKLMEGLGHGVKRDSLQSFFETFGGLILDETQSNGFTSWKGADFIKENFEKAKETMWYDLKKASAFKGFNLEEELQRVMKKHIQMTKKVDGLSDEDKSQVSFTVNEATIQQLLGLVGFEAIIEDDNDKEEKQAA